MDSVRGTAADRRLHQLPVGVVELQRRRVVLRQRVVRGDDQREVNFVARAPDAPFAEQIALYPLRVGRAAHVEIAQRKRRAPLHPDEGRVAVSLGQHRVRFVPAFQHGASFGVGDGFGQLLVLAVVGPDLAAAFRARRDQVGGVDDQLPVAAALADDADVGLDDDLRPLGVGPVVAEIVVVIVALDRNQRVDALDFEQVHRLSAVGDQAAEVERVAVGAVEPRRGLVSEVDGRVADDAGDVLHVGEIGVAVVVPLEELQQVVGEDLPHAHPRPGEVHRFEQQAHAVGRGQDGAFAREADRGGLRGQRRGEGVAFVESAPRLVLHLAADFDLVVPRELRFGVDVEAVPVDRGPEFRVETDQVPEILVGFERLGEGDDHGQRLGLHGVVQYDVFALAGDLHLDVPLRVEVEVEGQLVAFVAAGRDVFDPVFVDRAVLRMGPGHFGFQKSLDLEPLLHVVVGGVIRRDRFADQHVVFQVVALLQPAGVVGETQFRRREFELGDAFGLSAGEFRCVERHLVAGVALQGRFRDDAQRPHAQPGNFDVGRRGERYGVLQVVFGQFDALAQGHLNRHPDARQSVGRRIDDVARRAAACGGQQDDEGKQCGAEWFHGAFF